MSFAGRICVRRGLHEYMAGNRYFCRLFYFWPDYRAHRTKEKKQEAHGLKEQNFPVKQKTNQREFYTGAEKDRKNWQFVKSAADQAGTV